nr:unnamed protein product [Spirometra erinaceieuropaei]
MCIHESGIDRSPDTPTTSNTPTMPSPTLASSPCAPITATTTTTSAVVDTDTADFSCPHRPRTFTSRIGLVGHLRIHHTETGEPVPGAPTYTHQARLNCPHCPRTLRHRMGLFGHMRIHDDLRQPPLRASCAIIGVDFLAVLDLLVDCRHSCLCIQTTTEAVKGHPSSVTSRQLAILDHDSISAAPHPSRFMRLYPTA